MMTRTQPALARFPSGYQPIEDYGMISDLQTVALVGKNGSIERISCRSPIRNDRSIAIN